MRNSDIEAWVDYAKQLERECNALASELADLRLELRVAETLLAFERLKAAWPKTPLRRSRFDEVDA
jgi:hypothetical protein